MIRIGAVNWDCSLPPETYFGFYQTQSLSPRKFRTVTPYYADILSEDRISYHVRTQEEYDRELRYALDAGIDYFAYVWYPEEGSRRHTASDAADCSGHVYELNYARRMHQKSAYRHQLSWCAIAGAHPFADADLRELALAMRDEAYEKLDGRPLCYLFGGERPDFVARLREVCRAEGTPDPYCVAMVGGGVNPSEAYAAVEAISAYACCKAGIHTYQELSNAALSENENRLLAKKPTIPLFVTGWNPMPRVAHPAPWVTYPDTDYAPFATADELMLGARALSDWMKEKPAECFLGHILAFAWNEFEEGGIICPTLDKDGGVNLSHLHAFREAADYFRKKLGS